jgi:hypothetical protein
MAGPKVNFDYIRGYLVTDSERADLPQGFSFAGLLHGYYIYTHELLRAWSSGLNGNELWLLGFAIDIRDGASTQECADRLCKALSVSEDHFFDVLDFISGRYVIVYAMGSAVRLLHDACAVKAVYYVKNRLIAGSHARLVAEADGAEAEGFRPSLTELAKEKHGLRYRYGYPGLTTPYENVIWLAPNTLLEFETMTTRRYFPRGPLVEMSVEEAADIVLKMLSAQIGSLLSSGNKLLVSLTAGIDSRVTLAATAQYMRDIKYFTYFVTKAHSIDMDVARNIAGKYGLDHDSFVCRFTKELKTNFMEFGDAMAHNAYIEHSLLLNRYYLQRFGKEGYLHVRSNLGEIGRAFYRKLRQRPKTLELSDIINVYNFSYSKYPEIVDAFSEFRERALFRTYLFYNYDPYDLFYWEFRMGAWHSQVVIGSDIAFETCILFNAREILKVLLSVPFEDRLSAVIFKRMIKDSLPQLEDIPINGDKSPTAQGYIFNISHDFGLKDEVCRLVVKDMKSGSFCFKQILKCSEEYTLDFEKLPEHGDCQFKIQTEKDGKWVDAVKYYRLLSSSGV